MPQYAFERLRPEHHALWERMQARGQFPMLDLLKRPWPPVPRTSDC
jgi:hypothetical protein